MRKPIFGLSILVSAASCAAAQVPPAQVSSNVQANFQSSTQTSFGTNSIIGIGTAQTIIGSDAAGAPFIQTLAATPSTAATKPYLTGSLNYSWAVTSTNGSTAPVLVHISTSGWINSVYGFTPFQPGFLSPNGIDIGLLAKFTTQTDSGINVQSHGLQSGGINFGVIQVDPVENFTPLNGGSSVLSTNFNASFSLWVIPNTIFANSIQMLVQTGFRQNTPFVEQYAVESFSTSVYLDPVITIDASYGTQFSLAISEIPLVAVPEPATGGLLVAGICALVSLVHRRHLLSISAE